MLSARRSSAAPFGTSDNAYGGGNAGRSTVGKVINSQGQMQRGRGEAKVPINPDKVRKMTFERHQQEIKQTAAEKGRQAAKNSGALYGWTDSDRDAERATNLAKNRVSNIGSLPGASSSEMRKQAGPYEGSSGISSPRKGGADSSYKLRNGSSIQLHHQTHSTGSRPSKRAQ